MIHQWVNAEPALLGRWDLLLLLLLYEQERAVADARCGGVVVWWWKNNSLVSWAHRQICQESGRTHPKHVGIDKNMLSRTKALGYLESGTRAQLIAPGAVRGKSTLPANKQTGMGVAPVAHSLSPFHASKRLYILSPLLAISII